MDDCTEILSQINKLKADANKLTGQIEQNDKRNKEAEDYLRENGYDPDNLSSEITTLQSKRDAMTQELESEATELAGFIQSGLEALV